MADLRKRMVKDAKRRAKKKGVDFNITYEDVYITDTCPILGIRLYVNDGHSGDNSPTLDRIDNSQGYTPDNVWVISQLANQMKSSASLVDLIKFSGWAINHYVSTAY